MNSNLSKSSLQHLVTSTLFVLVFAVTLNAGPGPQYWESLRRPEQFEQLKAGDKIVYVCKECKTASEVTIGSHDQAMELCKEGASFTCPSCKMKTKVVLKQTRNDPSVRSELVMVNEKGEECAFFAKPTGKMTVAQYNQALSDPAQFQQLKAGDKIAYVCNECKTVSEITIDSHDHAMELCKDGATVMCPSCKMKTKVVLKRQRNDPSTREEVVLVNDKGEECAFFLAKPAEKK